MSFVPFPASTSSGNSTSTLLTASSTFTGAWEDVSAYSNVCVAAKTDQDGTLVVEFSPDGTNADSTLTSYYRTGRIEAPRNYTVTRKYVRVSFTNTSTSAQTYLRLQTSYGAKPQLNAPIDGTLAQNFDAIITRPTDFRYEVATNRRQGLETWNKWGYNTAIGTSEETIWEPGGLFVPLTSAETLTLVSTDANDADGDTGARGVVIYGVDGNWDAQIEVVLLDGTTPVVTSGTWLGVNRVALYSAGSSKANEGEIAITATTAGTTQATIPAGLGVTQQCVFFVPRGYTMLVDWIFVNGVALTGGGNATLTVNGWVTSAVSNARYQIMSVDIPTSLTQITLGLVHPFPIGEKSIFELTGEASSGSMSAKGRFSGIIVRSVST